MDKSVNHEGEITQLIAHRHTEAVLSRGAKKYVAARLFASETWFRKLSPSTTNLDSSSRFCINVSDVTQSPFSDLVDRLVALILTKRRELDFS